LQGRVALLQFVPISVKALKPKETDFEPQTLGDHIRKRRLELMLTQKQAADRLEVTSFTVLDWEKCKTEPLIGSYPAILRFLAYDPFPEPRSLPERIAAKRRDLGWSVKVAAGYLGIDEATWKSWERGQIGPLRKHRARLGRLLRLPPEGK